MQHRSAEINSVRPSLLGAPPGLTLYSIGQPTDEEQLYLEYINRARLDPAAEGLWLLELTDPDVRRSYEFFNVNLALMAAQFADLNPAPPLSMNEQLTAAARQHSQDMLQNDFQSHIGTDGSDFSTRALDQGYRWSTIGENVFSGADSVLQGHAAFQVDWEDNPATGGMQEPPGHRLSIHSAEFREVGVGVVNGRNGSSGPQVVTQDFANRRDVTPFITGVVYYDLNGNRFYDLGEGLGGVRVLVNGSSYYAVSAGSGGYSVPVPGDGEYAVTFSVPGHAEVHTNVVIQSNSLKVDHVLEYSPPVISGPETPAVGRGHVYSFSPVGGATAYQWRQVRLAPLTLVIDAEDGLALFIADVSPNYEVIDHSVRASGSSSFRLAHPLPDDQFLTLNSTFRAGPATHLSFATRLGWASTHQVARAQISVDNGASWEDVWNQAGTGGQGESTFTTRNIALDHWAGSEVTLRFVYDLAGDSFFPQTEPGVGFYIDDIVVGDAAQLFDETFAEVTAPSLTFGPTQPGEYLLSVRPKVGARYLPWGPARLVQAQIDPATGPNVRLIWMQLLGDRRLQIDFTVANPGAGIYEVQAAPDPGGPWIMETASIEVLDDGARFRVVTPAVAGAHRFYRVVAQ